jgi:fructokinase
VPSYAFYGEGAADRLLSADVLNHLPGQTRLLQFGSYAMVVEPIASTLRALVVHAHQQGAPLIAYDPNVRLNVEPSLHRWRETLAWMLPRTQLLKVSEEDLGLLHPGSGLEVLASEALSKGVSMVVVTRGASGAVAWTAGGARAEVGAVPIRLVDTVGAGDTFQAALLTWLAEHDALSDTRLRSLNAEVLQHALTFAAQAAAVTCSRRGADLPGRADLS